ncbi:hypothetical protein PPTG_00143 [Phytophthora nicotianae INRA-310]|uniref:DDE Tnp4 domain-containing protein n=1 Tax=Phytophthora nicotianae (strain INRA-310) TaxID=761204 RepID=W2RDQ6_PHYN3|nr:hypothetical protein PPTG_00143 [Phytophthora nicotianae INRA-310]ETN23568.1 hypothetical protein PPTG_00143 [Phytophthora nicotianae INRA-310]
MAPSRNRTVRTQDDEDEDARSRWDALFVAEDVRSRALNRIEIAADRDDDSDAEFSTASPVYDRCLRVQGPDRVLRMCNFAPIEFERLWELLEDHVLSKWGVGRGKKCKTSPKDVLFMMLAALKHCGNWETVSSMFDMDASAFQKMIKKYIDMYEPFLYTHLVKGHEAQLTSRSNSPFAPLETFTRLYGHKVEVSVLPTGVAINCTAFEPGAVSDITMFNGNAEFHRSALRKQQDEGTLYDDGPGVDKFEEF